MAYAFNEDKTKLNIKIATKSVSVAANHFGSVNFTKTDFGLGENEDLPLGVIILSVQQGYNSGLGFTARETHPYQTAYVDKTYIYPRGEIAGSYDGHITQLRAYVWNDASSQQSIDVAMVIAY